jgi:hypothetical protein
MPVTTAGLLFAFDWDWRAFEPLAGPGLRWDRYGFDLFRFPSNLRLAGFDIRRAADRLSARGRSEGWQAVLSHHEQFGALTAALVAERLRLPGAPVEAVLAAQHKWHARRVLERVAPEANLAHRLLDATYGSPLPADVAYPCFAKPVKAAFSVLAGAMGSAPELERHTRFGPLERWIIERLVEPFDAVCRERLPKAGSAHRLMLEEPVPLTVPQFNLDGWVCRGDVHALGVVDAVCHPGTRAFMRWEYPGRLPAAVQARALDVARRFLNAIGYSDGLFNLEFFWDPRTDRLSVIECNPRLASQFSDLYQRVDGIDPHALSLAIALGRDPLAVPRRPVTAGAAASLVYRVFPGQRSPAAPDAARLDRFHAAFPDGIAMPMPKQGRGLARDFKWTGSHRYGIVHLGADDRAALRERAEVASALLGWPAPWHPAEPAVSAFGSGRLLAQVPGEPEQGFAVGQHGLVEAGAGGRHFGGEALAQAGGRALVDLPEGLQPQALPVGLQLEHRQLHAHPGR